MKFCCVFSVCVLHVDWLLFVCGFSRFLCFFLGDVAVLLLIFVFCGLLCDVVICFDMISCHIYL